MANREDLDEMLHYETFHQGLHCLLREKNDLQRNKYNFVRPDLGPSCLQRLSEDDKSRC